MDNITDDKITIIEGPPPTFERTPEFWIYGLTESAMQNDMVLTRLRTFNGNALVERCYRAWSRQKEITLEYRTPEGLKTEAPIVAARNMETDEGDVLLLWLRLLNEDVELELGYGDEFSDDE